MTRKTILALAILLAWALPAAADDCGKSCEMEKPACAEMKDLAQVRAKLAQTDANLVAAHKQMETLSAEQRTQLADAREFLLTKTTKGRALAPTLGANARLLAAAAAQEEKAAGESTEISKVLHEMSRTYASLASMIAPPKAASQSTGTVSVREARAELAKAAAVWQRAASEKAEQGCCADKKACQAARKVVADLCPMHKTMVDSMQTLGAGYELLAAKRQVPSGDVTVSLRDEFTGEAAKLHAKLASCGGCGDGGCDGKGKADAPAKAPVDTPPPT